MNPRRVPWVPILLIVTLAGLATGCSQSSPTAQPSVQPNTPSATQASSDPAATAAPLTTFQPVSGPAENLVLFDALAQQTLSTIQDPSGDDFVNALIAAGAQVSAMQLTSDQTTEGKRVDSVFWSLLIDDDCMVGQYRPLEQDPEKPKYVSTVLAPVGGKCLIGETDPVTG